MAEPNWRKCGDCGASFWGFHHCLVQPTYPTTPPVEVRVVDPTTGGAKGSKLGQLAWAPPESLMELASVYGAGIAKYPNEAVEGRERPNYSRGYKWSLSVNAMFRHILLWLNGETQDTETGRHHLAHAAWHCLTLIFFEKKYPELDDVRWTS